MIDFIIKSMKLLAMIFGFVLILVSCESETDVQPGEYPEQLIYMPSAYSGFYVIDNVSQKTSSTPTEGQPYRYVVDLSAREFNIPLAVYRSGINNQGEVNVDIIVDTDTITELIAAGTLENVLLLPSDKYSIVSSVKIADGEEIAKFNLTVDLDFLRINYPDKVYALGIGITSAQRETNPKLGTTIVVLHTKMTKPTANFTYSLDNEDPKIVEFNNTSLMAESYAWNFGDGSAPSSEKSPTHTYAGTGTYVVSLTAYGITGEEDKSVMTADITIP